MDHGIAVGVVGGGPPSVVDPVGTVVPAGAGWTLEWWIGGDDRWHVPEHEVAVRQQRTHDVPVVETAMRVPGGDAVQRVYGVAAAGFPIVVEVENRSPAPFVVALVIRGATRVASGGTAAAPDATSGVHIEVDRAFRLSTARAPSRWARTSGSPVLLPVSTGRADAGSFPGARDRSGRLEVALLHPVAHRTTLRAALTSGRRLVPVDVRSLPDAAAAVAGWRRVLEQGMGVQLPDGALEARIRAARAEMLLRGQERSPAPQVVAALEDWGFDAEAAEAWRRLSARGQRRAAARPEHPVPSTWAEVASIPEGAAFLLAARRLLVDEGPDRASARLCADWPDAWRGQPVEVSGAPVAGGSVSYAVRWHGTRPALLWDAPEGVVLRVPGLDPSWSSDVARGDALLAATEGAA